MKLYGIIYKTGRTFVNGSLLQTRQQITTSHARPTDYGANPNAMNDQGQIPLHLLQERDHDTWNIVLVELLLKYGADVNAQDKKNMNPVIFGIVQRVPVHHADTPRPWSGSNAKDGQGQTPLQSLVEHGRDLRGGLDLA